MGRFSIVFLWVLVLVQGTALAGQRHFGLRDCRYRWLPLVGALEGFQEVRPPNKPLNDLLFSYAQKSADKVATLSGRLFPSTPVHEVSLEGTLNSVLDRFYQGDPQVIVEALEPKALAHQHHQNPRQALLRQIISPNTGHWAKLAFVQLPREVFMLEMLATNQESFNEASPAFEKLLDQFFLSLQDGPRYNITSCEALDR